VRTSGAPAAWRLPGGETHYEYWRFDGWGNGTNQVTTYTRADGGLATRTNQYVWALNTYTNVYGVLDNGGVITPMINTFAIADLLVEVVGPDGSPLWTCGGFETVTWTNDYPSGTQTNRNLLLSSEAAIDKRMTVVQIEPSHTTNMTRFLISSRGFSFLKAPMTG